jgi:putative heme-binding domain-containing protein
MVNSMRMFNCLILCLTLIVLFVPVIPQTTLADSPASLTEKLIAETPEQLAAAAQRFGDPRRGALTFYQPTMNCARCHEGGNLKRRLGPNLAEKREFKWEQLVLAVLQPSAEIKIGFETTAFQLFDGRMVHGILVEKTDAAFVVDRIEQPEQPLRIPVDDVDAFKTSKLSSMPDGLANQLANRQQFLDLVSYLADIASGGVERADELKPSGLLSMGPLPEYEKRIDHVGLLQALDSSSFDRGAETYRLNCASCHGTVEAEGSMPTSLRFAAGQFKNGNDPFRMYQTLTHGFGMMNPQRWMVPQQKYEVIHYIREHFLKKHNSTQFTEISKDYLAGLPTGDTRGPAPVESRPWSMMNYGPSLNNTVEVSRDGSNIAQKGIIVRLDDGPGGVESGQHWMLYEHDTMRVAAAWSGKFIDYEAIAFNGAHNRHPRVAGEVQFSNPTGPGWGKPDDASFVDARQLGRDGKRYGPLDRSWAHFEGLVRFGNRTILKYSVGESHFLETPGLIYVGEQPVYTRVLDLGPRTKELVLQIAHRPGGEFSGDLTASTVSVKTISPDKSDSRVFVTSVKSSVGKTVIKSVWEFEDDCLRIRIPAGEAGQLMIGHALAKDQAAADKLTGVLADQLHPQPLASLTEGGPANWPQRLTSKLIRGADEGPYAVDVFKRPTENPWNCRLRLTGLDFLPDGNSLVTCAWDGSVWLVSGFSDLAESGDGAASQKSEQTLTWRRIAAGLFQPLGIKWIEGKIFVTCRDQLVCLSDLNSDGEMDWYENFNSDHQVTEHFHEFAMGLQTDAEGNFYYAKSARHALPAVVPHHGTLLKVSADGQRTEILANGFRAANGVCLNPDGSFVVTDQEGHWNPKNRINWVRPGGFYGNMFGYHDVTDEADSAMEDPLCWITNSFDRSPSELLWVTSDKWGPLKDSLLNFSYGYGQMFVVPHETVDGQIQGGMAAFPLDRLPTGVMRGRFHPLDGQLYCCGMFAWAGDQHQPGGLYRIRYTGQSVYLPTSLHAQKDGIEIGFSGELEATSVADPQNYSITTWDLKRTKNYGSKHFNEQPLQVESATLLSDGKTVRLKIPAIKPTWGMEIQYSLKSADKEKVVGKIHNSIFKLAPAGP